MTLGFRALLRTAVGLLAFCSFAAIAQPGESETNGLALATKTRHVVYDVENDGRSAVEVTLRTQVIAQSAIEYLKTYSISFSTSIQNGEILEAYTLKKDGRKVEVPAGNYQRRTDEGRGSAGPFFSDRTSLTVIFPDLAVGDVVHVRHRISDKEPMFPGHFSTQQRFSPFAVEEDVRVTVRAPKSLRLGHEEHNLRFSERATGDLHILEWRHSNVKARERSDDDDGLWSFKEIPSLFVSTFDSYEAITKAYRDRALPKAVPTQRIVELAHTISGNEKEPREKARLLYEWVSRNVTYGGNCIGLGAVVPRDLDVILDNRMGDCKDHATLLQALLSAESIASDQVLVNAGSEYELPGVAVVSMVNHVMTYLPAWDMYLDATAKEIPFGYLPGDSYAKPVLHVGRAKALARIPGFDHTKSTQQLEMSVKVADNGAASGTLRVKVHGPEAASARAYMRELKGQAERDFVKMVFEGSGYRARGTVQRGDVEGFGDEFEFGIQFDVDNYLKSRTGSFHITPVMSTPLAIMRFARFDGRPPAKRAQVCWGFHSVERMDIEFPAGTELMSMPSDTELKGSLVDFQARYKVEGSRLHVTRSLDDKTPGGICSADRHADFERQATPVGEHLRTEVLYKRR